MMASLPPGTLMLVGALLLPCLQGRLRQVWTVGLPIVSLAHLLWFHPAGHTTSLTWFDQTLTPIRVDKLSLVFGYVFHFAAILAAVFALHVRNRVEHLCALLYVAASIGAVFAGDLLSLFVYWEITAIASVFLIWAAGTEDSLRAGLRYVTLHIASGVLVLSGAIFWFVQHGTLSFGGVDQVGMFGDLSEWGPRLLLLGFGIKAAFPLLHAWLPDAYPKSTVTGTVYLSAFTTKMAIYALARGFAQCELLITVGCVMVLLPLVHALLANDLRRTLAHVLNNQLGFMVVAIGVGTPLAISGAAAQAFAHVLYKGLLFMATGAVLYRTGTACQTQLGGLRKQMPWTFIFCLIGAGSVFPLNCGFVTKALVLSAVGKAHLDFVWLVLIIGATAAFLLGGLKIIYFIFLARPQVSRNEPVSEAPPHMLVAMGLAAGLCIGIGCFPQLLYQQLPYSVADYHVYTWEHVITQLQLLCGTTLVFAAALSWGWYPQVVTGTLLDVDWIYRRLLPSAMSTLRPQQTKDPWSPLQAVFQRAWKTMTEMCSEAGIFGRTVTTNVMAIAAILLLAGYLFVYYEQGKTPNTASGVHPASAPASGVEVGPQAH